MEDQNCDLFPTFVVNRNIRIAYAKKLVGEWLARVDHEALGRNWSKKCSSQRTFLIGFFEKPDTYLHVHAAVKLPEAGRLVSNKRLKKIWKKLIPAGSLHIVDNIRDIRKVGSYITKDLGGRRQEESWFLSSEFHKR